MLVNESILMKVIDSAIAGGADFAEVYVEDTRKHQYTLLDSKPEKAISGHMLGAGVRLFSGTEQIYTFTNDLSEAGLITAAKAAVQALKAGGAKANLQKQNHQSFGKVSAAKSPESEEKWKALRMADEAARAVSSAITQVTANLADTTKSVQIFNSEGIHRTETRGYLNLLVDSIAEEGGMTESGFERTAFTGDPRDWKKIEFARIAGDSAQQALRILKADWAPAGEMPVVLNNAFGGVIFHEACGHGLETTAVAKNASVFCGKLGQRIANECVTAIDDGTIPGENGSLEIDDEGETTRRTVLIEKGVLKSYIVDKMGSRKTGFAITGSGRRQDYRYAPTSRMRNTFLAAGDSSFEEMIRDVDHGLYAKSLGGGSVMPGTGAYNFAVSEAFLIKNGRIDKQVKGASLIGTGIETLGRIVKVSNDLKLCPGTCGSLSGWVPVTVGQPQILVSKLTVGGKV